MNLKIGPLDAISMKNFDMLDKFLLEDHRSHEFVSKTSFIIVTSENDLSKLELVII